jgi:hypothetical protein
MNQSIKSSVLIISKIMAVTHHLPPSYFVFKEKWSVWAVMQLLCAFVCFLPLRTKILHLG